MQYDVKAMSINPESGEIVGEPRVERIDTATNQLFQGLTSPWEVEDQYHAFWNRLNDSWERDFPSYKDKVVVLSVTEVRQ